MAKLGISKERTIREKLQNEKSFTKNKAGGVAFEFEDPAEYLLATIGSSMFMEPKYYTDVENVEQLKKGDFSGNGLDEQAIKIINACIEVCLGDNPRDVFALAHWARTELRMRTTPQVMIAVAAHYEKTKPFVRDYITKVALRADDVKQVVAAYEYLFGWKSFPACLKKGVSDKLSTLSEYEILKYNTKKHPTFADLLKFCDRRKDFPFSKPMREYILTGEVIDIDAIPMVAARKELTSRTEWSDDIPELARLAGATWEVLVSQFGNKAEVWEAVIPLMGYMALLKNLGNFLSAGVSDEMIQRVASKISSQEEVLRSKQLPFRFLAAYRVLNPSENIHWLYNSRGSVDRDRRSWDKMKTQVLVRAVEDALEHSVANVIELPGITCIAADNSGSMTRHLSEKSVITAMDVANILGAILYKKSEVSIVSSFGAEAVWPILSKNDSILTNMNTIAHFEERIRGHATNAWKVIDYLIKNKIFVDRIVVLSDMQCYDSDGWARNTSLAEMITKYRREVNKNCYLHSFDLLGYGTSQTPSRDPLSNVVGGFSEKIFDNIIIHEGYADESTLPSLEWIREHY